jgi:hypothetical protein
VRYQEALRGAREFVTAQGGQVAPLSLSEEEQNPDVQDDLSVRAVGLEDTEHPYPITYDYPKDAGTSEFRFFSDGRQRTIQVGHIPVPYGEHLLIVPVHYFVVAAVILERIGKKLSVWDKAEIVHGVFVSKSLVPDQHVLEQFEERGLRVVDTEKGANRNNDYYDMRRRALREAKSLRLRAEQSLIARWRESDQARDSFLVIDGTLMNMRDEKNVDRCVGVSKSFGSRYFDIGTHNRILSLRELQRSWTFRFHDTNDQGDDMRLGSRERLSWYLRLRESERSEPEFGLIRVEISKTYFDQAALYADRFSRSLLSERLPTSYPAPRWDKHLYPVRQCENYLSSVMPSSSTIIASMRG